MWIVIARAADLHVPGLDDAAILSAVIRHVRRSAWMMSAASPGPGRGPAGSCSARRERNVGTPLEPGEPRDVVGHDRLFKAAEGRSRGSWLATRTLVAVSQQLLASISSADVRPDRVAHLVHPPDVSLRVMPALDADLDLAWCGSPVRPSPVHPRPAPHRKATVQSSRLHRPPPLDCCRPAAGRAASQESLATGACPAAALATNAWRCLARRRVVDNRN